MKRLYQAISYSRQSSFSKTVSAKHIQKWFRLTLARTTEIHIMTASAIQIQKYWRAFAQYSRFKITQYEIQEFKMTVDSAILIQKNWRCLVQYSKYQIIQYEIEEVKLKGDCAIAIQQNWRCYVARTNYEQYQNEIRASMIREDCVILIQKNWRCFTQYSDYKIVQYENLAANIIQYHWRHQKLMRETRKNASLIITRFFINVKRISQHTLIGTQEEKEAALVIERFFIFVRNEIEGEIERMEQIKIERDIKRKEKSKRKKKKKKRSDSAIRERVELPITKSDNGPGDNKLEVTQKKKTNKKRQIKKDPTKNPEQDVSDFITKQKTKEVISDCPNLAMPELEVDSPKTRFSFYDPVELADISQSTLIDLDRGYIETETQSEVSCITNFTALPHALLDSNNLKLQYRSSNTSENKMEEKWMEADNTKQTTETNTSRSRSRGRKHIQGLTTNRHPSPSVRNRSMTPQMKGQRTKNT